MRKDFGTKTMIISDYFGLESGRDTDKIAKAGVHVTKSTHVDAPMIEEYPLTWIFLRQSSSDGIYL